VALALKLPPLTAGRIAAPKVSLTPFKAPGTAAPKIRQVKITPVGGGFHVQHAMSGNTPDRSFVFANPAKMVTHLRRIENTEWMKPMQDPAGRIVHDLNIGETP
jgi:hypothetical protein